MERQVLRLPKPDADGLSMGEKRADERTRTADLLITSLLAHILAPPTASGNSAYLGVFR
jgi:hypothetical protein